MVIISIIQYRICRVNAITLLVTIIALGNSDNRNENARLESIFDLMDFNSAGKISTDEFVSIYLYHYILKPNYSI
jgi:Ca2+-binding EF-hand superfamily protein